MSAAISKKAFRQLWIEHVAQGGRVLHHVKSGTEIYDVAAVLDVGLRLLWDDEGARFWTVPWRWVAEGRFEPYPPSSD